MIFRKIFLVDDDPDDRGILIDALHQLDARDEITYAENGVKALELLRRHAAADNHPCLIILDLNMPKLTGTQILERLKADERFKDIPVIIYSTSVNALEKEKCMKLGAHSYVTKPISFAQSIETARQFLGLCEVKVN